MPFKMCPHCGQEARGYTLVAGAEAPVCDGCARQYQTRITPTRVERAVFWLALLCALLLGVVLLRQFTA